jgi:predicted esterase
MPSWFDYNSLDSPDVDEDLATLQRSVEHLLHLVEREERAGVPSERIVLAGFAQGGAVALAAALQSRRPLGGVLALSTWLPRQLPRPVSSTSKGIPVLFCHGTEDRVVRFDLGQDSLRRAEALGLDPQFKSYTGLGHEYGGQEMIDVQQFLLSRIASATTARGVTAVPTPKGVVTRAAATSPSPSPGAKRPRVVVGGAPAHYNAPWLYGITSGAFAAAGVDVEWRDCQGGSSDMARLLAAGELDLAVLSTDGAVAELARADAPGAPGAGFRIVAPFVASPLTYGVYVAGARGGAGAGAGADADVLRGLEGQPFAVSRRGSLSHVMTYLHANQVWPLSLSGSFLPSWAPVAEKPKVRAEAPKLRPRGSVPHGRMPVLPAGTFLPSRVHVAEKPKRVLPAGMRPRSRYNPISRLSVLPAGSGAFCQEIRSGVSCKFLTGRLKLRIPHLLARGVLASAVCDRISLVHLFWLLC